MMRAVKCLPFFFLFLAISLANAQDSLKTLSAPQLMELVKQFHPVAKQADIIVKKAKADVTTARGSFDPVLQNETAEKTFDGTNYYYYNRPQVSIPTWFGIELSAGLEELSGNRTDPMETRGETNYWGISVPLAKNLLMDKRRAALQTAKIFRTASEAEKRSLLNDLMLDAMYAYWSWVQQYQVYRILTDAVIVNEKRFEFVKTSFRLGEKPAIDTTEALTQLQNFRILKNQAWLDFQNSSLDLSNFLWAGNAVPYVLPIDIIPADSLQYSSIVSAVIPELNNLLEAARKNHPELVIYNFKLDALGIDKKLKFQELLPTVNLRYHQLGKGYDVLKTTESPLYDNNYQYGLSLAIPLRLSQGRGEYRMAKLKISEVQLLQRQKQWQIENKVKSYYNELVTLKSQIDLQEQNYKNYQTLQRGEEIRFEAGESSLFLMNARENKTLETLQKLQELKAKFYKMENSLQWSAGLLFE